MKKYLSALALLLCATVAFAVPRTPQQARAIAMRFLASTEGMQFGATPNLTLSQTLFSPLAKATGVSAPRTNPAYYVYNIENNAGFVIVSGDDAFKEVLGYSTGSAFDENNLPDGFRYWLQFLNDEMDAALAAGATTATVQPRLAAASAGSVEPLLKSQWNQNDPYNLDCPYVSGAKAATGCVATGMAQVMYYWKAPLRGVGKHANARAQFKNHIADFGATEYQWDLMCDTYKGYETGDQEDAVAQLMYHCGIATDMIWDTPSNGSGTQSPLAGQALVNYFGYNPYIIYQNRDIMSLGAWKAVLIDELQAGRPVMYSGMSSNSGGSGHFFVCDGYDAATGKFHFNWGWSGYCDGYYAITSLEPGTGGIGAGAGSFNYYQAILTGVQPTMLEPTHRFCFEAASISAPRTSINRNGTLELRVYGLANSAINFDGQLGIGVYQDGKLIKETGYHNIDAQLTLGVSYDATSYDTFTASNFAINLANGDYDVCIIVKDRNDNVRDYVRAAYGKPSWFKATVTNSGVTINPIIPTVSIVDNGVAPVILSNELNYIFNDTPNTVQVTIQNTSADEFYDEVGVRIVKGRQQEYYMTPCRLAPGETKVIDVPVTLPKDTKITAGTDITISPAYGNNGVYSALTGKLSNVTVGNSSVGINDAVTGASVVKVEYFSPSGMRLTQPLKGVNVRKTTYSNGKIVTEKLHK